MQYNFTYYVHHHGAGHVTRAIAIAEQLIMSSDCAVTFLGTGLSSYKKEIPSQVKIIELPPDVPNDDDRHYCNQTLDHLHYSPLNVTGLLKRNSMLISHFNKNPQTICIVDVSCEVVQFARLCGIPTVVIRQHGNRQDLTHKLAYNSAAYIIAPYTKSLSMNAEEGLYEDKTLFSGGFSRFDRIDVHEIQEDEEDNHIALLLGKGGSNLDIKFVKELRRQLPERYVLHILGDLHFAHSFHNIIVHGHVEKPHTVLKRCSVVICNAGHNTVMEMASLGKRFICIPASRPFAEQLVKASHLERLHLAVVVFEEQLFQADWVNILHRAKKLQPARLSGIIDKFALEKIAKQLKLVYESFFFLPSCTKQRQPKYA